MQGAGGIGGLIASVGSSGNVRYYPDDANGNAGQLVTPQGDIVAHYEYDPFGNAIVAAGDEAESNVFRFSTKFFEIETGLYYYGYRFYIPELGRWNRRDPQNEYGGLSLMAFISNNPICLFDILGLYESCPRCHIDVQNEMSEYPGYQTTPSPEVLEALEYFGAGSQIFAGAVLMIVPEGTITKGGGVLLIADGIDKLQALIRGDKTEYEKYIDNLGFTGGQKQAAICAKEFFVLIIDISVGFAVKSPTSYGVDPSMKAADEAAGIIVNGQYIRNPTAKNLTSLITDSGKLTGKKMSGQYMYVVDNSERIIIGTRAGQRMPHPTLVGGLNPKVRAAGIIDIRGGRIYSINNASGHFKPSQSSLKVAAEVFGKLPKRTFHKKFQGYLPYVE